MMLSLCVGHEIIGIFILISKEGLIGFQFEMLPSHSGGFVCADVLLKSGLFG